MARKTSLRRFTVPSMDPAQGAEVAAILQQRLHALNDLALTLKHVHWNVVGPHFIGVHEMIDPQVEVVRAYADETAERIATLGSSVKGTPGTLVAGVLDRGAITEEVLLSPEGTAVSTGLIRVDPQGRVRRADGSSDPAVFALGALTAAALHAPS